MRFVMKTSGKSETMTENSKSNNFIIGHRKNEKAAIAKTGRKNCRIGARQIILSCLYGLLLSLALTLGFMLEKDGYITIGGTFAVRFLVTFIPVSLLSLLSFLLGETIAEHAGRGQRKETESHASSSPLSGERIAEGAGRRQRKNESALSLSSFLPDWLFLVLLILPVFLAEFPGFFVYDAHDELYEVLTRTFTAHHPLLHVLLLGRTIAFFHKFTGSWNAGIAVYIFLQMLVITAVFSLVLQMLRKFYVPRRIRVICLLFLGLFPTVVMYVLCSAKDGLFSAFLLLLTVFLYLLYRDPEHFLQSRKKAAGFVLSALLMMLFRYNGFYSFLVFVPFGIIFLPRTHSSLKRPVPSGGPSEQRCPVSSGDRSPQRRPADSGEPSLQRRPADSGEPSPQRRPADSGEPSLQRRPALFRQHSSRPSRSLRLRITAMLLLPVALFLAVNTGMTKILTGPDTKEYQEMLTVPISQLARAYNYQKDVFSKEDILLLHRYLPEENLNHYEPLCTDLLKVGFNNEAFSEDKSSFVKLWLRIGKKAPAVYVNAWLLTSYGYWYPYASLNVYAGRTVYTFTYDESSYFGYEVEKPGTRTSLIPAIDTFFRTISLTRSFQKIPVIRLFFAPAFWFFVFLWQLFFRGFRRRFCGAVCFLPVFLTWLTVLLGPCSLVRYVIILWFLVPVYFLPFGNTFEKT